MEVLHCGNMEFRVFFAAVNLTLTRWHSYTNWRLFLLLITVTFIDFTRVSPPGGCHPHLFLPVRPRLSTILCKFAHNFFPSAVTTWRVSPGTVRPLVTPLFLPELAELGFRKLSYHRQTDRQTGIQTYRHAEMPAKTLPENITGIYYAALRLVRLHFRMCHVSCWIGVARPGGALGARAPPGREKMA